MNKGYQGSSRYTKPLYEAPMSDEEYEAWFKEFVEGWRCRICKTDLTLDNFGGIGENHMIFCKGCKATEYKHWLEKTKIINRVTERLQKQYRISESKFY